jgi:aminoglycoside adenylyltransferase-like protein
MVGTTLTAGDLVDGCARTAVGGLRQLLGEELVGAWLIGSGALGGAVAESSDLDLVAVCVHAPSVDLTQQLVAGLTEEAMTWPVRGLEFVLYPRAAVASASRSPQFALNLNVGPRMPLHLSTDAAAEPAHWFVIDLAILREHGLALYGPPAHELVAPIPRRWLLDALEDGLAWHAANEPALHQSVLNAGRAWRFAAEGVWSSKDAAAGWVLARTEDPILVQAALAIRHGDRSRTLDPARVNRFVRGVQARVQQAAAREPDPTPPPAAPPAPAAGRKHGKLAPGGPLP